ncbi:hypothetical protein LSUE1_G000611 [Lachnellula suecica]|uniref:Uncharacterized protein n=1 Tax=Lachnellula suecica TaxID=602035 RepID=A0A8T9CFH1_9HELO|nr:hypothetical protein LSUE1_G000611 [Lachnellula suecica]
MAVTILPTFAFWLHLLIELPASLNFFLNPAEQLSSAALQTHAIIRQYAVLLFTSSLVALIFAVRPVDRTSRNVAGALAVYHLAPTVRALSRVFGGGIGYGKGLGGPWIHLAVHGVCFLGLNVPGEIIESGSETGGMLETTDECPRRRPAFYFMALCQNNG